MSNQEPPFCVQVELVEGCSLHCSVCGIKGIRAKAGGPYKFMTMKTAEAIASSMAKLKWHARGEFAVHGEPSLNPQMCQIVAIFRKHLPRNQLMMTSNGTGFVAKPVDSVHAVMRAGLNILALDDYRGATMVPRIVKALAGPGKFEYALAAYPEDGLEFSPHRRGPVTEHRVVTIADLVETSTGSHSRVNNHCGCGSPKNDHGVGKRCAKPFRELSIRWDGRVSVCCNDWRGLLDCGSVVTNGLDAVWNGAVFDSARKYLLLGRREFDPCKGCDALSYRVGLLPDHRGHLSLPAPTARDARLLQAAATVMTKPVKLPWEER